jgi:hypothetical protein
MKANYRNRLTANCEGTSSNGWKERHREAVLCPHWDYERALVQMLSGWLRYADAVQNRWESGIGQDGVLGPSWAEIGSGLRGLLNGELGRLDGGTLDALLVNTLREEEFDPDNM